MKLENEFIILFFIEKKLPCPTKGYCVHTTQFYQNTLFKPSI